MHAKRRLCGWNLYVLFSGNKGNQDENSYKTSWNVLENNDSKKVYSNSFVTSLTELSNLLILMKKGFKKVEVSTRLFGNHH